MKNFQIEKLPLVESARGRGWNEMFLWSLLTILWFYGNKAEAILHVLVDVRHIFPQK